MNIRRSIAKLTGWSIILMAVVAAFVFGFANPQIYNADSTELLKINLTKNMQLYNFMLVGIILIILLDIIVSWTIYLFFKDDNRKLAMLSFLLRIIYTVTFLYSFNCLLNNALDINLDSESILRNYTMFYYIWSLALIVFGFHLLIVGILMKIHKKVPKLLWYTTIFAAGSYILVHFLKTATPSLNDLASDLETILSLPMMIGEMGLAIWLIIRGGKNNIYKVMNDKN